MVYKKGKEGIQRGDRERGKEGAREGKEDRRLEDGGRGDEDAGLRVEGRGRGAEEKEDGRGTTTYKRRWELGDGGARIRTNAETSRARARQEEMEVG